MKRRIELDWVRAAAMLGVVMIHASAAFVSRDSRLSLLGITPALFLNQASRAAVPLFFLLSLFLYTPISLAALLGICGGFPMGKRPSASWRTAP